MEIFNVKKYSKPQPDSHQVSGLSLFDWRSAVVHQPATRAGLHLTRRYRIHPSIADVLAGLAGLGEAR
jgi:hypothetical protein